MANDFDWLQDNDDDSTPSPGDLRALVKKLTKERDEAVKVAKEQEAKVAELSNQVKATSLRDLLTAQGIDPRFAKLAERDGVEPTEEAVKAWRQENDGIYAFKPAAEQTTEVDAGDADEGGDDPGNIPDGLGDALAAGQTLEGAGHPSGSQTISDALRAARSNPGQFKTEAELDEYLRSLGAPSLQSLGGPVGQE